MDSYLGLSAVLKKKLDMMSEMLSQGQDVHQLFLETSGAFLELFEHLFSRKDVALICNPVEVQSLMQFVLEALQTGTIQSISAVLCGNDKVRPLSDVLKGIEDECVAHGDSYWDINHARRYAEGLDLKGVKRVVCMFGYGDGTYARALSEQLTEDSVLLVYEPGQDDIIGLRDELQENVDFYMLEGMKVLCHPAYDKVFPGEYRAFIHAVNENRERVLVNKNTLSRFKEDAPKNVLKNLHILKRINLVNELSEVLPTDVPVIIVAAGPSLDKNIDLLRRAQGHCLIFAVDTAMKYLLKKDIIPDIGITIEPIKPMANYEDERCFDVPHIFDAESNPEIVGRHRARKLLYNCRDYVRRLFEGAGKELPNLIASGGSVATAAFAICYELGMKNIVLIGQDLAYEGTSTHAGGVESAGINGDIGTTMIDGIYGGQVRTRSDWLGYLRWFENAIEVIKDTKKDIQVIDATEGGALIHGSRVMTLSEAIDELMVRSDGSSVCDYDFAEALAGLPPFLSDEESKIVDALTKKSFAELSIIKAASGEAKSRCDKVISGRGSSEDLEFIRQARRSCEASLMYPLINNYAVSDIAEEVSRLRLNAADPLREVRQQRVAFAAIEGACGYFEGVIADL